MQRWMRKKGAKIVPEFIKSRVRGRLYGYRKSQAKIEFDILHDETGPVVSINNSIKFRISEEDKADFSYHFITNGASIEEMFGFIQAANSARTLFDVGAHKALFALVFCAINENNHAVAYEPSPSLSATAKHLSRINGYETRLDLQPSAIGDASRTVAASVDPTGFISFGNADESFDKFEVQITTIDDECKRLGLSPDILKIDIEGYEYEALQGASDLLKFRKPVICLELHLDILEQRGIDPRLICDQLTKNGYRFFSCLGQQMSPQEVYGSAYAVLRFIAQPPGAN
jgi:FkbM family methyltransferase